MVLCWYIIGWNTDQILASWVGLCFVQLKFGENYYSLHVSCTDYLKSLTFVSLLELTVHNFYNMMMEWSNAWRILLNCLNENSTWFCSSWEFDCLLADNEMIDFHYIYICMTMISMQLFACDGQYRNIHIWH